MSERLRTFLRISLDASSGQKNQHDQTVLGRADNLPQEPLPVELAEIETELAQLSLPASTINRDELLYRAGWAAAARPLRRRHDGALRWLWPATSAALAATVLMLLFGPGAGMAGSPGARTPRLAKLASKSTPAQPPATLRAKSPPPASRGVPARGLVLNRGDTRGSDRFDSRRSPLALRHRALMRQFDSPPREIAFDDTPTPPSKTSRELLRELLPELKLSTESNAQQDEKHWNWPKQLWKAFS